MDGLKLVMAVVGKERAQRIIQNNLEKWCENLLDYTEEMHPKESGESFTCIKLFKKEGRGVVAIVESLDESLDTIKKKQAYSIAELAKKITLDDE